MATVVVGDGRWLNFVQVKAIWSLKKPSAFEKLQREYAAILLLNAEPFRSLTGAEEQKQHVKCHHRIRTHVNLQTKKMHHKLYAHLVT